MIAYHARSKYSTTTLQISRPSLIIHIPVHIYPFDQHVLHTPSCLEPDPHSTAYDPGALCCAEQQQRRLRRLYDPCGAGRARSGNYRSKQRRASCIMETAARFPPLMLAQVSRGKDRQSRITQLLIYNEPASARHGRRGRGLLDARP